MEYAEVESLKRQIKKKHGSLSRFAKLIGQKVDARGYSELAAFFAACRKKITPEREKEIARLKTRCDYISKKRVPADELSLSDLIKLKRQIELRGGVTAVAAASKALTAQSIWQILDGTRSRKTKAVIKLFKHLQLC